MVSSSSPCHPLPLPPPLPCSRRQILLPTSPLPSPRTIPPYARSFNWQPGNIVGAAAVAGLSGFERIFPLISEGSRARGASTIVRKAAVRTRAPREKQARRSDEEAHRRLVAFVEACGGSAALLSGWRTHTDERMDGNSAGTYDTYFIPPKGPRLRSRAEVARLLKIDCARLASLSLCTRRRTPRTLLPLPPPSSYLPLLLLAPPPPSCPSHLPLPPPARTECCARRILARLLPPLSDRRKGQGLYQARARGGETGEAGARAAGGAGGQGGVPGGETGG